MWETQVQSLGWEDPLEKEMATHSVFLPGEFHGQKSLAGYSPWGHKESDTVEWLSTHPWKDPCEPTDLKMKNCILKMHCLTVEWTKGKEVRNEPGKECSEDPLRLSGPNRRGGALGRDAPKLAIRDVSRIADLSEPEDGFPSPATLLAGPERMFQAMSSELIFGKNWDEKSPLWKASLVSVHLYRSQAYKDLKLGSAFYWHPLEIHNSSSTRGPTFSFYTGPCRVCSLSWFHVFEDRGKKIKGHFSYRFGSSRLAILGGKNSLYLGAPHIHPAQTQSFLFSYSSSLRKGNFHLLSLNPPYLSGVGRNTTTIRFSLVFLSFLKKIFLFCIGVQSTNNVVIVLGA